MFYSRLLLCLLALMPVAVFGNSAPEKGPPAPFQPTTANPVPPPPTCPTGRCAEPVDPVVLSGGKLYYPMVDVEIPGLGRAFELNLRFFRGYSNQDNSIGVLGKGWTTTLDIFLDNAGGSTPSFRSDTGNQMFFTQGTVTFHDGHVGPGWQDQGWTLEAVSGGDYEMGEKFGWKYRFTSTGQLRYIEDPLGHRLTYNRNGLGQVTSITDASSRSLTFTYDITGKLSRLTDPLGRVWGYGYHPALVWGAGMLAGVRGPAPLNLTENYYYAADGNMVSLKNPRGNVTSYQYDAAMDRVTRMTHPNNQFVQFTYNNFLGTSAMTDEDGKVWQYEYAGPGLVTNIIDPLNGVHHYQYNSAHELTEYRGPLYDAVNAPNRRITYTWNNHDLTQIVDETGTVKDFTYSANNHEILSETITLGTGNTRTVTLTKDGFRRVTNVQDALAKNAASTYDAATGLIGSITDRRNKTTTFTYDAHGNATEVEDANLQKWKFTYDAVGRLLTRSTPIAGTTVTYTYDVADRITRVTDPLGKFWDFTHDAMGNRLTEKTPLANTTTTYTYDSRERRLTTKNPLNNTTTSAYNGRSLIVSVTDPLNRVTTFDYDDAGRRTKLTQPPSAPGGAAIVTDFTYNLAGELTSAKDAKNQVTQFAWDPFTRRRTTTFPNATTEISEYDAGGDLVTFTNRSGQVQTRTHNANGWLTAKNCPTCGSSYSYDDEGNLTQALDVNAGSYSWTYDNLNRTLTSVQPGGTTGGSKTVSYTYDNAGRPLTMTYPDSTTLTYSYNSRSLLSNIASTLGNFGFAYDDAQRRTGLTFPNNHTGAYTYDTASRPTGVTWNTAAPSLIASQTNVWNSVGNITSSTTTHGHGGFLHGVIWNGR